MYREWNKCQYEEGDTKLLQFTNNQSFCLTHYTQASIDYCKCLLLGQVMFCIDLPNFIDFKDFCIDLLYVPYLLIIIFFC